MVLLLNTCKHSLAREGGAERDDDNGGSIAEMLDGDGPPHDGRQDPMTAITPLRNLIQWFLIV